MNFGILVLYAKSTGKSGFYNCQEVGMARAMKNLGYKSWFFCVDLDRGQLWEELVEENSTVVHIPMKSIGVHGRFDWNIIKKYKIDVLQFCSDNQIFAPSLIRFCENNGIKLYNYIGTVESKTTNPLKHWIFSKLFEGNARAIKRHKCFAKTETVAENIRKYGVKDVEVLPVGLDNTLIPYYGEMTDDNISPYTTDENGYSNRCTEIRRRLGIPVDRRVLIYVGRINETKRPLEALKLFSILPDDYFFLVIGSGEMNGEFQGEIDSFDSSMSSRIKWIKEVPNSDIHQYYYVSDFLINTCLTEIFGMSIVEAMYQGCTVVACHAPGPDYIIDNGRNGYLVSNMEEAKELILSGKSISRDTLRNEIENKYLWQSRAQRVDKWIREGK